MLKILMALERRRLAAEMRVLADLGDCVERRRQYVVRRLRQLDPTARPPAGQRADELLSMLGMAGVVPAMSMAGTMMPRPELAESRIAVAYYALNDPFANLEHFPPDVDGLPGQWDRPVELDEVRR